MKVSLLIIKYLSKVATFFFLSYFALLRMSVCNELVFLWFAYNKKKKKKLKGKNQDVSKFSQGLNVEWIKSPFFYPSLAGDKYRHVLS